MLNKKKKGIEILSSTNCYILLSILLSYNSNLLEIYYNEIEREKKENRIEKNAMQKKETE